MMWSVSGDIRKQNLFKWDISENVTLAKIRTFYYPTELYIAYIANKYTLIERGIMCHLGLIVCAKLKVEVSIYFVTSVILVLSEILCQQNCRLKNEKRRIDFDVFDRQEKKSRDSIFIFWQFLFFNFIR